MKKTMKLQVIAVLALLVLGACNTSQDVASGGLITKRKYNKGFHINLNKKYKSTKEAEVSKVDEQIAVNQEIEINEPSAVLTNVAATTVNTYTVDAITTNDVETVEVNTINQTPSVDAENNNVAINFNKETNKNKVVLKAAKHEINAKKNVNKNSSKVDDKLIALLLCIFVFSPLGVWWHEGKKWTKRCTFNLLWWIFTCGLGGLIHGLIVILGD